MEGGPFTNLPVISTVTAARSLRYIIARIRVVRHFALMKLFFPSSIITERASIIFNHGNKMK